VLDSVPSTNRVAAELAVAADPPPTPVVVVAHHQSAGRGRLDRTWVTPPGSALTLSALLDPRLPDERWPLLPLAAGLAVLDAVRPRGVPAVLKWPNDVVIGETADGGQRKLAGILVERVGRPALAVVGIGINVDMTPEELPTPVATSLRAEGARDLDRVALLGDVLRGLDDRLALLRHDAGALLEHYRSACATLAREVAVALPDGTTARGRADAVDDDGRLVVTTAQGQLVVGAGDVVHVRPSPGSRPG